MGLESGRLGIANSITNLVSNFRNASQGIVYKVILDENDEVLKQKNIKGTYALGAVQFRLITDKTTSDELLPLAFPIDKNSNRVSEITDIAATHGLDFYLASILYNSIKDA